MRSWTGFLALSCLMLTLAACRTPTDVRVELRTDVPCQNFRGVSLAVGPLDGIETRAPTLTTTRCAPDGRIGAVVVVPSGEKGAEIALKVVAGVGKAPETCAGKECITARRVMRFVPHEQLDLIVDLRQICAGVVCGASTQTCVLGECRSAAVPDGSACEGTACGEGALPTLGLGAGGTLNLGGTGGAGTGGAGTGGGGKGGAGAAAGGGTGGAGAGGKGGAGAAGGGGAGGSGNGGAGTGGNSGNSGNSGTGGTGGAFVCSATLDEWNYVLDASSSPWRLAFGDPSTDIANNRLLLTQDDVVLRQAAVKAGYTQTTTLQFAGDLAVHLELAIPANTVNFPAIRGDGSGASVTLGGLRYGKVNSFGTFGAWNGQKVTASSVTVTLFVKGGSNQIAARLEGGGQVIDSGFVAFAGSVLQPQQLIGANNAGDGTVTVAPITGCSGLSDAQVDTLYAP